MLNLKNVYEELILSVTFTTVEIILVPIAFISILQGRESKDTLETHKRFHLSPRKGFSFGLGRGEDIKRDASKLGAR